MPKQPLLCGTSFGPGAKKAINTNTAHSAKIIHRNVGTRRITLLALLTVLDTFSFVFVFFIDLFYHIIKYFYITTSYATTQGVGGYTSTLLLHRRTLVRLRAPLSLSFLPRHPYDEQEHKLCTALTPLCRKC